MNKKETLRYLYSAGGTRRYHNRPKLNQNVAEHSFGVALIISTLHPNPSANLLTAAIRHDLSEKKFGDFLRPAKEEFPQLKELDILLNVKFWDDLPSISQPLLSEAEELWLEYADIYECLLFAQSENCEEVFVDALTKSERVEKKLHEMGFDFD